MIDVMTRTRRSQRESGDPPHAQPSGAQAPGSSDHRRTITLGGRDAGCLCPRLRRRHIR
jgi:hypothetical protein